MWFVHVQKATPVQRWKKFNTASHEELAYYIIHFTGYPLKCFKQKPANISLNKSNLTSIYSWFSCHFWYSPNPFLSSTLPPPQKGGKFHMGKTPLPRGSNGFETKWASRTRRVAALDPWWWLFRWLLAVSPMRTDLRQNTVFRERIDGGEP